jgi:hypothetical protein
VILLLRSSCLFAEHIKGAVAARSGSHREARAFLIMNRARAYNPGSSQPHGTRSRSCPTLTDSCCRYRPGIAPPT